MAKKFVTSINLNGNEIQNVRIHVLASDPGSPVEGQIWYNSTDHVLRYRNNGATVTIGAGGTADDSSQLNGQSGAYYLSRTNHTGTQLAATISDFNTAVRLNKVHELAVPTAAVPMGGQKHTGLAAGSVAGDSLRYEQVVGVYAPLASPTFTGTVTVPNVAIAAGTSAATVGAVNTALGSYLTTAAASSTYAPLASPTFTGTVTVPNVAIGAGTSAATIGAVNTALGSYLTTAAASSTYLTSVTATSTYAPLASPTFTGTPTLPTGTIATTQTAGNSTTAIATTAFTTGGIATALATAVARANHTGTQLAATISDFSTAVDARVGLVVDGAPGALDTLNELAAALGDDPNFATTIAGQIAAKATKVTGLIGNAAATSIAFAHNLASQWVTVQVYEVATLALVETDVVLTDANTVTLGFSTAPATNAYRVVVTG